MIRTVLLVCIVALLVGCQGAEPPGGEVIPLTIERKPKSVIPPTTTSPTKIALVVRKGPPITVGFGAPDKLFDPFRDPKVFVSEFNDLPAKFDYPYRSRIWETAHVGLGEILYDGDLVAAMYHEDRVGQDRVDELVAAHKAQMDGADPDKIVIGKKVTYWFWSAENQRLMICAYQKDPKWSELTVAMGDDVVMDALGMSPQQAEIDAKKVDAAGLRTPLPVLVPTVHPN